MNPIRNLEEALEYLGRKTDYERRDRRRFHPGEAHLQRMEELAEALGHPERSYASFHIGGSKGKGSTALFLEAILVGEGIRTGTYLSPHLRRLGERIRLNGRELSDGDFAVLLDELRPAIEAQPQSPTFFEIITALAMEYFRRVEVEVAIFEVGLGGRLDATNILRPLACAVPSIDLEHTAELGSTVCEIAREKAGIIKAATPILLGPVSREVRQVFAGRCLELRAPLFAIGREIELLQAGERTFDLRTPGRHHHGLRIQQPGRHLQVDAALAVALRAHLPDRPAAGDVDLRRALSSAELPARLETFAGRPAVLLDAAHTPESMLALEEVIREWKGREHVVLIFAIARDKELGAILDVLPRMATRVIFTLADELRGTDPTELKRRVEQLGPIEALVVEPPEAALRSARQLAGADGLVCVAGSFYLAGRLRPLLTGEA